MNTDFKINGQSYRFATSAENVKYGSGTVKDALDDIKNFAVRNFTPQMKKNSKDFWKFRLKEFGTKDKIAGKVTQL